MPETGGQPTHGDGIDGADRVKGAPDRGRGGPEVVARIDATSGRLLSAPGFENVLGLPSGALTGLDLFDVVARPSIPQLVSTLTVLLDQPGTTRAVRLEVGHAHGGPAEIAVLARCDRSRTGARGGRVVTLSRVRDVAPWATSRPDPITDRARLKGELAIALVREEVATIVAVRIENLDTFEAACGERAFGQLVEQIGDRISTNVEAVRAHALLGASTLAFLMVEPTGSEPDAMSVGRAVRDLVSLPFDLDDTDVFLFPRVAVGAGLREQPEMALRATLRAAERLSGPTVIQVVGEPDRDVAVRQFQLRNELRHAIEREELRLLYQPYVDTHTGIIAGAEALIRWEHPELGRLGPGEFVPLAEETDFIDVIGAWVIRAASGWAGDWLRRTGTTERFVVAVNVSPRQLIDPAILTTVADALAVADLEPARLCCEVTESALLAHEPVVDVVLRGLLELGIQLAIDDFGTGHASLDYLQRVPAATVKIDRQFVRPLPDDDQAVELVRGIIDLAHAVGTSVVAEGVEHAGQAEVLRALNCDYLQGFLISRPLDEEHFESLMTATAGVPLLDPPSSPGRPMDRRTVVIVDAELAIVGAVRAALAGSGVAVAGTATSIEDAVELVRRVRPDVIVSERLLADGDATEELHRYVQAAPDAAILIFTGKPDERSLSGALTAGAKGYIDKQSTFEELVAAIEQVAGGDLCVAPHLLPLLTSRSAQPAHPSLSDRELDVLVMLARGSSTTVIADELLVSVHTVRNDIARLLQKLGARTRLEAIAIAADQHIVQR